MMSRTQQFVYIAITLIGAVFVLVYRGPFWTFVRSYMGDWLVVQFIYLIARFWVRYRWRYHLAIVVLLFSIVIEIIQYFAAGLIPSTVATDLTVGRTFDPLDIAVYMLGIITVVVVENYLNSGYSPEQVS